VETSTALSWPDTIHRILDDRIFYAKTDRLEAEIEKALHIAQFRIENVITLTIQTH
jgi:hypothetical protein